MRTTSERLPWLEDEPAEAGPDRAARAASTRTRPARGMWPWYLLFALLIAVVGLGAWWLGTRQREAAPPVLPAEEAMPISVNQTPEQPVNGQASPGANALPAPVTNAPPPPSPSARARPAARSARPTVSTRPRNEAVDEDSSSRPTFPADDPMIAPPPTGPTPVVLYHPNPNRGRVVQLGAFPTRAQAEESWRKLTRRYPYLATKPKMVNTVDVRGLGGGRPTRMYRLQLGTSSQAQSAVICQQLERAGQSCVVVY